jgi:spore germination protein KB
MPKIKITNHQLFALTAQCSVGGLLLVISAALSGIARQDAWLVTPLTFILGVPVMGLYWFFLASFFLGRHWWELPEKYWREKWIAAWLRPA